MKLKLTILLLGLFYCVQFIIAKPIEKTDSIENHNKVDSIKAKPKTTHWSIAFNGGICLFDGDIQHSEKLQILPNSYVNFAFNFQLEYLINPVWGLFLQYNYLPYSASIANNINLKAISHDITINGTINLVNLFKGNRKRSKWGLNINVGAGCAFFNGDSYKYVPERKFIELSEKNYIKGRSFVIPVGLTVEYSPIEAIGVFFQADYRLYQKDVLEGILAGQSKDGMGYVGLGVRYKIGASKKRQHAKTAFYETIPPKYDEIFAANNRVIDSISSQLDSLSNEFNAVSQKLARLEEIDSLNVNENKNDKDTILQNNSYIYLGDQIIINNDSSPIASIYFSTNSINITERELIILDDIAKKLKNNTEIKIDICGYCDNTGPEEYNNKLSRERAENVKKILVELYKIDSDRISVNGKGSLKEPKDNYIVNRKCDIFIKK